jgi:hypothetical protein
LSMTEQAMSITLIICVLVILLFGFDYVDELVVNEFFEPSPGPSNPEFS